MIGREDKDSNDLFFVCSLIDYIARKTKNQRSTIVENLGKERIMKLYTLADVYHSYNIDQVSDEFIEEAQIKLGCFDNVKDCHYTIPTHWDIGKVYKRLIIGVIKNKQCDAIDALIDVYNSFVSKLIDDYNGSFYYENPDYILATYMAGKVLN